jgi:hypothetical protein
LVLAAVGCSNQTEKNKDVGENGGSATADAKRPDNPEEAAVFTAVEALHGRVTVDANHPGNPVVGVDLSPALNLFTDAGLNKLKDLKSLQTLNLRQTAVTDAGLKGLKELKSLKDLDINGNHVSATGVKELQNAMPQRRVRGTGYVPLANPER